MTVEMLAYTPAKGIVTIKIGNEEGELHGRLHKLKRSRFLYQGQYFMRHTLLRAVRKLIKHDKAGNVIERHTDWGVAMKEDEKLKKVLPELDVVEYKGEMVPAWKFDRRKPR